VEHFRPLAARSLVSLLTQIGEARAAGYVVLRDRDGDRHGVLLEQGCVRGVHVAGRFDPLLSVLEARGVLDRAARSACLGRLGESPLRSGALADSVVGLPRHALRDALRAQHLARFSALLSWAEERGHDARFEPGNIAPEHAAVRIPLGALFRAAGVPLPGNPLHAAAEGPDSARRQLRRAALLLHPDRHPGLGPEERRTLELRLAQATAQYHGFGHVA